MNIGSLLTHHARCRADHPAVIFEDQRLSYKQLNERVNRLANALLDLGVKKGDKIATILPNCLELLETYWTVGKIGAVVVPLSQLLNGNALATLLRDSESTTVIANQSIAAALDTIRPDLPAISNDRYILTDGENGPNFQSYQELTKRASAQDPTNIEISDDDPFNIIYSSGTTGQPKGIVHTHYIRSMYCSLFASSFRITPESVIIHSGSLVFNGAFVMMMPALFLGATFVLMPQYDPNSFIETIQRERVTHTMMVPSQIVAMINSASFSVESLQSLEAMCTVGAPLHREHREKFVAALPDRFYELYGLTEGFITVLDKKDCCARPGSVGVPLPFFEMRIVNDAGQELPPGAVGEIVGRGPMLMPGYYNQPALTAQAVVDGWLHTGDLGYVDEDGFLFLVDRRKDLIISGGANVYPKDIEEIIVKHPAVREAAVFGIPHEKWGETPLAAVILNCPGEICEESLREWINERVDAKFQRVHKVVFMEEFPRSTAGKTLKRAMREPYWAGKAAAI